MKNKGYRMLAAFKNYLNFKNIEIQEDDSRISFERKGLNYLFLYNREDPVYFRLILPKVLKITENNKAQISNSVNLVNQSVKVAKATIIDEDVWISVEQFVYSTENIEDLFDRVFLVFETFISELRNHLS